MCTHDIVCLYKSEDDPGESSLSCVGPRDDERDRVVASFGPYHLFFPKEGNSRGLGETDTILPTWGSAVRLLCPPRQSSYQLCPEHSAT